MVFSSNLFLFLFLPVVLAVYYASPRFLRNSWLLAVSLLFYAWGGPAVVLLLSASIGANYLFGLWVDRVRETRAARWVVALSVVVNLIPLAYYKYAGFCCETWSALWEPLGFAPLPMVDIAMPIGISFFTFQALSYVIDVYRRDAPAAKNPVEVALYIAFFPQLIAGPIVRYRDVADQINQREETVSLFAEGIERFIIGLAKKVLLANSTAAVADQIFAIPTGELTASVAWLGIVCYTLQIYYDFSGYSDMAIGLGLMFGIRFLENFRYPYVARSVTDFWRRWHISLSTWFRDYLYIPLGGNRGGAARTYFNLLLVFLLCGLWHGADWAFVAWGLYHGLFLIVERVVPARFFSRVPAAFGHAYLLLVVMGGWVFFRAGDLDYATGYLAALAGLSSADGIEHHTSLYLDGAMWGVLLAAVVGAAPWLPALRQRIGPLWDEAVVSRTSRAAVEWSLGFGRLATLTVLFLGVAVVLSAATYNPFIYFRF